MSIAIIARTHPSHNSTPFYQAPGYPIAYFPSLVPVTGSVKATVLLCQLIYWTPRARDATGWIYKSQLELMAETGLSLKEQRQARAELKRRQLIEERYDRLDHQLWLRVNVEAYNAAILLISDQVPKGHLGKSPKVISGNAERAHGEVPKGDLAKDPETTLETTVSETTPEITNNVDTNVDADRESRTRQIRLTPRQEEVLAELETQLDTNSRGAFCVIVSDRGLGEERALSLLHEAMDIEDAGQLKKSLSECFMDLVFRDADRQGIDLGFKRPRRT